MKKNLIIAVVVFLLVISFGVYSLGGKSKKVDDNLPDSGSEIESSRSIKDLLTLGKSQKCTYDQGIVFISSGKMRGDMNEGTHMIVMDSTSYVWTDNEKTGLKMTFDPNMSVSSDIPTPEAGASGQTNIDYDQKTNYKCENWNIDNSVFELPKGITFQDMSKLVNPVKPASDSNSAQCGYCDTLEGDSKTQCLAALNCN